ncbi:Flp family type IVb pilin [Puniceibacterium confluentis]|uniref:Flp family type IVb pilin n=1 Tax=Puniceibacterium confluentis TaxID=1958944 RepID=UPI0011B47237|nr:Flp family type IVb pilin [Puniceibacterium confluentis]
MKKMTSLLKRFRRNEDGATLVEYGIALGLAVTLGAGALLTLSGDVGATMTAASTAMPVQATSP